MMNSNNDNGDDDHLNNLFFIFLDQEKSQVLSSGKSKDLEIGSSTGVIGKPWVKKDYIYCSWCIVFINVFGGCSLKI